MSQGRGQRKVCLQLSSIWSSKGTTLQMNLDAVKDYTIIKHEDGHIGDLDKWIESDERCT